MSVADSADRPDVERTQRPHDNQIDFRANFRLLWRYRIVIVAGAILFAALGFVRGLLTPLTYVAEVALAVSQPNPAQPAGGQPATTATFMPFVESQALTAKVIQELKLGDPPYQLSPTTFFDRAMTVEEVRGSTVIRLTGRLRDPILVTRMVNRVAEMAVEASRRVSQQEAVRSRDEIKGQFDEAKGRLERAEARLHAFREVSQVDLLRRDVDAVLNQRERLLALPVEIEEEKARLAKAEEELAKRQRIETVRRTIDSEPALMESARKSTSQPSDLIGLEVRNEFVNPVYQSLDTQIAGSRTYLAALERQKAFLMNGRRLDAKQLTQLYEKEAELSRLELDRDLASKVYLEIATRYETTELLVAGGAGRSAELQIIEPALPPNRPESRHLAANTLLAFVAGLMLSTAGVLVYNALSSQRRQSDLSQA